MNKINNKIKYVIKHILTKLINLELFLRKKLKTKTQSKKLLIIRIDNIGDFILFSPTLIYYKKLYPNYSITILVKDINKELANRFNSIDKIISFDKQKYNDNLFYRRKLLIKLLKENFEIAIYPTYSREPLGDYFIKTTNAKEKTGFDGDLSNISIQQKKDSNKFYTKLIIPNHKISHEVERNKEFIEKLGDFPTQDFSLSLPILKSEEKFAKNLLKDIKKDRLVIAFSPVASSKNKMWPIDNFYQLTQIFDKKYKIQIILIGGKQDISIGKYLESKINKNIINLIGETSIFQTAAVLKLCDIYIGNDSGPMHIASTLKIPIIEISSFVKNHPLNQRFRPWKVPNIVLQPLSSQSIKDISVEQVANTTFNLLSEIGYNQI
jgi:ADP-heptose:LPS heptosyltransferase